MFVTIQKYWAYFSFFFLASIALFANLGTDPLACWDESRQAVNAVEMLDHKNPFITTYEGEVDLWNTKPSLLVATQSLSFAVLGISEFALRLPSALAALLLCLGIFRFFIHEYKSYWGAFTAVSILLSISGYNGYHGVRTGDYEGFLTLFATLFILYFYKFLKKEDKNSLFLFFIFFTLSVLSKGITAFMFLPGLFLYALFSGNFFSITRMPVFWIVLLSSLLGIILYYGYREYHSPGFLQVIYDNELGGRFNKVKEGNSGAWNYYLIGLLSERALPWVPIILLSYTLRLFTIKSNNIWRTPLLYFGFLNFSWLFFISIAKTKLAWYDVPMFPLTAILGGLLFSELEQKYKQSHSKILQKSLLFFCIIAILISGKQISENIQKGIPTCEYCTESNQIALFLKDGIQNGKNYAGYILSTQFAYKAIPVFYKEMYQRKYKQPMVFKIPKEWGDGDRVLLLQANLLDEIPSHIGANIVEDKYGILEIEIYSQTK